MGDYLLSVVRELWPNAGWSITDTAASRYILYCNEFHNSRFYVSINNGVLLIRLRALGVVRRADFGDHEQVVNAFKFCSDLLNRGR